MTQLQEFFPSSVQVRLLRAGGVPRLATTACGLEAFHDGRLMRAGRISARLRRAALRMLLLLGLPAPVCGTADSENDALVRAICSKIQGCARYVALAGTPGNASKVTLVLQSEHSEPLGYAKVGSSAIARSLIQNEASVLAHLDVAIGPRLLGVISSPATEVVITSPVLGTALSIRAGIPDILWDPIRSTRGAVSIESHPFVRASRQTDAELTALGASALSDLGHSVAITHGDAAPWNALQGSDGRIRLFDWEYGSLNGLPLTDVAHWSLQVAHLALKLQPRDAVTRALRELTKEGLTERAAAGSCLLASLMIRHRTALEGETRSHGWWDGCAHEAANRVLARGGAK